MIECAGNDALVHDQEEELPPGHDEAMILGVAGRACECCAGNGLSRDVRRSAVVVRGHWRRHDAVLDPAVEERGDRGRAGLYRGVRAAAERQIRVRRQLLHDGRVVSAIQRDAEVIAGDADPEAVEISKKRRAAQYGPRR